MKRVWIGAGLLAVLLVLGLLAGSAMERWLTPGAERLEQAGDLALAGRWGESREIVEEVEEDWEDRRWLVTALTDHEIIEGIDAALAELDAYGRTRDADAYNALCQVLARRIEAAGQAHKPTGENFW